MGMFDNVILPEPIACPTCGTMNVAFQSKDRDCMMEQLAPQDVDRFYASCANRDCKAWIEFRRKIPVERPVTPWQQDFEMVSPGSSDAQ